MHTVTLLGSGKIGQAITALLTLSGRYKVRVCDQDLSSAQALSSRWKGSEAHLLNFKDSGSIEALLSESQAVLSALPFFCNPQVAELAKKAKVHYLDLTEDVQTTKTISSLSQSAQSAFIPQCGLAPGFVSIAAAHLLKLFDSLDSIKMRVGALPIYPSNALKYNLTWSTDGLINEYINMCELVDNGKKQLAFALEGYERFSLDGDEYEAFNTSGGLGTLCESMEGKVRRLDYKSIRYPGHRDLVKFLLQDLRFKEDREGLKKVLERGISTTSQDKCIIFVEVQGHRAGNFIQRTYASTVYNDIIGGQHFGAIQITTASGICAALDLLLTGKLPRKIGLIRNEEIPLNDFLGNEFGAHFKDEQALKGIAH